MNTFREQRPGPALLDAGLAAVATGLLSWVYALGPGALPVALATLLAVIMLHPWLRRLPVHRAAGPVALVLVSLLGPGVLLVQYTRSQTRDVPLAAAASALVFLLVLGRLALLLADARRIAATDALTGLNTRRAFETRLRGLPPGRPAAVVLLDIDRFKRINDAFGHPAGDRVLCAVAGRLRETAGPGVTVARYGGEEFALLIPGADAACASELADRLRSAIGSTAVDLGGGAVRVVTISAGTAALPVDTHKPDELIPLADRALYAAKRAGRDRVVAATSPANRGTTTTPRTGTTAEPGWAATAPANRGTTTTPRTGTTAEPGWAATAPANRGTTTTPRTGTSTGPGRAAANATTPDTTTAPRPGTTAEPGWAAANATTPRPRDQAADAAPREPAADEWPTPLPRPRRTELEAA
ncbi:diguanylate cyclase domain-containing protein [Dactylosporangium sp. CA-052675]|uniref:GGDEF domain-containing protein n=1 Tax=Dactylosporangium sp. CA-052675 TaxID=3239927 RepID=UPI003D8A0444